MVKRQIELLRHFEEPEKQVRLKRYGISTTNYKKYQSQLIELGYSLSQIEHIIIAEGCFSRIPAIIDFHSMNLIQPPDSPGELINGFTLLQITRMAYFTGFKNTVALFKEENLTYRMSNLQVLRHVYKYSSDDIVVIAWRRGAASYIKALMNYHLEMIELGYTQEELIKTLDHDFGVEHLEGLRYFHPPLAAFGFSAKHIYTLSISQRFAKLCVLKHCYEKLKTYQYENEEIYNILNKRNTGINTLLFLYHYHELLIQSNPATTREQILEIALKHDYLKKLNRLLAVVHEAKNVKLVTVGELFQRDIQQCPSLIKLISSKKTPKITRQIIDVDNIEDDHPDVQSDHISESDSDDESISIEHYPAHLNSIKRKSVHEDDDLEQLSEKQVVKRSKIKTNAQKKESVIAQQSIQPTYPMSVPVPLQSTMGGDLRLPQSPYYSYSPFFTYMYPFTPAHQISPLTLFGSTNLLLNPPPSYLFFHNQAPSITLGQPDLSAANHVTSVDFGRTYANACNTAQPTVSSLNATSQPIIPTSMVPTRRSSVVRNPFTLFNLDTKEEEKPSEAPHHDL